MKHVLGCIAAAIVAVILLIPPVRFNISCTANSTPWLWLVLSGGFLSFLFLHMRVNIWLKLLLIFTFICCFTSSAPYLSFTLYTSVILVAFLYLLCLRLVDWTIIFKVVQSFFFLTILLIVAQTFQGDTLLNFNRQAPVFFGTINNPQMLSSLIVCLTPFLIIYNKLNIIPIILLAVLSKKYGLPFALIAGSGVYYFLKSKFRRERIIITIGMCVIILLTSYLKWKKVGDASFPKFNIVGQRAVIWKRAIKVSLERPITGWGPGTFQVLFPLFSEDVCGGTEYVPWSYEWTEGNWLAWRQAHNCWLQILFEIGFPGLFLMLGFTGTVLFGLIHIREIEDAKLAIAGLVALGSNMTIHFPTRMLQTVIMLIVYLAYCNYICIMRRADRLPPNWDKE